jgi:hypothetical protein
MWQSFGKYMTSHFPYHPHILCTLSFYDFHVIFKFLEIVEILAVEVHSDYKVSSYSETVLFGILSEDRVRALQIWEEFRNEEDLIDALDVARSQTLCDEYGRRFANIALSMGELQAKTEEARLLELQVQGQSLTPRGSVGGGGHTVAR